MRNVDAMLCSMLQVAKLDEQTRRGFISVSAERGTNMHHLWGEVRAHLTA